MYIWTKYFPKYRRQENLTTYFFDDATLWIKEKTAIDNLSVTKKSDLFDKIKRDFFQIMLVLLYGCTTWTLIKSMKKARWELRKNRTSCF